MPSEIKIPTNIFLTINGGLGDIISEYFMTDEWMVLPALKEKYPQINIKLALCTHSACAHEIFEHYPYLDSIDILPAMHLQMSQFNDIIQYMCSVYPEWTYIGQVWEYWSTLKRRPQQLYLSKEDKKKVQIIKDRGKYLVLHPFAGTPDRVNLTKDQYNILINRLIDELGYNIVVIGHNHAREIKLVETLSVDKTTYQEDFQSHRPEIINLVNNTNYRIAAQLSIDADAYIGNYSGPIVAAWVGKVRNVVYIPESHRQMAATSTPISWPTVRHLSFCKPIYPQNINPEDVINQTIQHLKEG